MKLRRIFVVILIIALLVTSVYGISLFIVRSSGYHQYPTLEELRPLDGAKAKHNACKIPIYKLKLMSTEQLAQALIDYPFLFETSIYSTGRLAADAILSHSSALQELVNRKGAKDVLLVKLKEVMQDPDPYVRVSNTESLTIILLYNHTLAPQLTPAEKEMLHPFDFHRRGPPDYPGYFD